MRFTSNIPAIIKSIESLSDEKARVKTFTMRGILREIRADVFKQFSENQGKWLPLSERTLDRKSKAGLDMRKLHESKFNTSLRAAYLKAGYIDSSGKIKWTFPENKPYAKEHQYGATLEIETQDNLDDNFEDFDFSTFTSKNKKGTRKSRSENPIQFLNRRFEDILNDDKY